MEGSFRTHTKPEKITDEQWAIDQRGCGSLTDEELEELELKTLSAIQLYLVQHVLREVLDKITAVGFWVWLEERYIMNNLANKIRLKEWLYTFRMAEGTPVQKHLNDFNSIIVDLESLDVKIEDKDKPILLVMSLTPRSCYIVILIVYRLRILCQTCCLRRSLMGRLVLISRRCRWERLSFSMGCGRFFQDLT